MIADILTKPLQGELFRKLRKQLLNIPPLSITYAEGCKTEDHVDPAPTPTWQKTNPHFQYPSGKKN